MPKPTPPKAGLLDAKLAITIAQRLDSLAARWQDEQAYEPWADYVAVTRKLAPAGATGIKVSRRPFRLSFTMGPVEHRFTVTARAVNHDMSFTPAPAVA